MLTCKMLCIETDVDTYRSVLDTFGLPRVPRDMAGEARGGGRRRRVLGRESFCGDVVYTIGAHRDQ